MTKGPGAAAPKASSGTPARTLFSGVFHPHLEEAFLTHMTGAIGSSPIDPVFVVVPTNYLGIRLSRLLAERTGGHLNVRFLTLRDLASISAPTPLPGGRTELPPRADEVVVRRVLESGAADKGYFSAVADRPGLSAAVLGAIRDLKEASYDPTSFREASRKAGLAPSGSRAKCDELARIWSDYEETLASRLLADESDIMRLAAERLAEEAENPPAGGSAPISPGSPGRPGSGSLVIYGFYDLNALQKRLLGAGIGTGGATVFFPYVDTPAMSYAVPTLRWFLSLGFEERSLGGADTGFSLPEETIVLSAPGEAREAREAVRALRRILEDKDLRLQDAAVVLRAPEVYSELFGRELDGLCDPGIKDRRLPESRRSFLETTSKLSRTRSGLGLLKLARAVESGFNRSDVIEFLALAELDPGACGDPTRDPPVSDWNAISSLAGITSGADQWLERISALAERLSDPGGDGSFADAHAGQAAPARSLRQVLDTILPPLSGLPGRAPLDTYLEVLTGVFREVTCGSRERDEVLAATAGIHRFSPLAGDVAFGYFCELLNELLDVSAPRGSRFGLGGPSVLSVMSARGLSHDVVVIPGLVEKQFPLHRRQDPILLDSERQRLNQATGEDPLRLLPLRGPAVSEERLLFHLTAGSATRVLVLTYPRLDPATARPRVPSVFVLDVLEELSGHKQDYGSLEVSPHVTRIPLSRRFPPSRDEALTRREFDGCSILDAIARGDASGLSYLVTEGAPLRAGLSMEETRWTSPFFTSFDGVVSSSEALDVIVECSGLSLDKEAARAVSATALEEYARCPFRYLVHRVLGIEPMEEPDDSLEFSPLDRGSLYHDVLERFMRMASSRGGIPLDQSMLLELLGTADRALESGQWRLAGYEGARRLERRALRLNLALWLRRECSEGERFLPTYFEVRFGGRIRRRDDQALSTERTVPFDVDEGVRLEFGGRIDRVDLSVGGSRARVVDYKTGKPSNVKKPLDRGRHLQLPIYILAADALLADRGAEIESAEYHFVTGGPRAAPVTFTSEELQRRSDDLRAAIRHIVHGITTGLFFPFPEDKSCKNCDYAPACGSAAVALAAMKEGDPNARFFMSDLLDIE